MICPTYGDVPANEPGAPDDTGGHVAELDTSYQTSKTNPATDIPENCVPASGWVFNVAGSAPLTTGVDGTVTITLSDEQLAMAETTGGRDPCPRSSSPTSPPSARSAASRTS